MPAQFNVEVSSDGLPNAFFRQAIMIRNDADSTIREKFLADLLIQVGESHNRLIAALSTGSVVMQVKEDDIRYGNVKEQ